jgi:hypothetical protein
VEAATVNLTLSRAEALVLFEWLASLESKNVKHVIDEAEQAVLWDIEALLECMLSEILSPDDKQLVLSAKQQVLASRQ